MSSFCQACKKVIPDYYSRCKKHATSYVYKYCDQDGEPLIKTDKGFMCLKCHGEIEVRIEPKGEDNDKD